MEYKTLDFNIETSSTLEMYSLMDFFKSPGVEFLCGELTTKKGQRGRVCGKMRFLFSLREKILHQIGEYNLSSSNLISP